MRDRFQFISLCVFLVCGLKANAVIHPLVSEDPSLAPFASHIRYDIGPSPQSYFRTTIEQDLRNIERLDCLTTNRFIDANNRGLYRISIPESQLGKIVQGEEPTALEKQLLPAHILGPIYRVRPLPLTYINFPTPVWTTSGESAVFVAQVVGREFNAEAFQADLETLKATIPGLKISCLYDREAVARFMARTTSSAEGCDEPLL